MLEHLSEQIDELELEVKRSFRRHPAAEIVRSCPGLRDVLRARVLAEFGDDPHRYRNPKARKNYAGTSPITRASGKRKTVSARYARNKHLADACHQWAFCSMNTSPVLALITTRCESGRSAIMPRCVSSVTGSSGSSTDASRPARSTTKAPPGPTSRQQLLLDTDTPWDA